MFRLVLTFWETSAQENLTPEASDRPETRLELLTRISSIRFFFHFLISSRISNMFSRILQIPRIFPTFSGDFNPSQQPLATTPENPQILVILCENAAISGIQVLA